MHAKPYSLRMGMSVDQIQWIYFGLCLFGEMIKYTLLRRANSVVNVVICLCAVCKIYPIPRKFKIVLSNFNLCICEQFCASFSFQFPTHVTHLRSAWGLFSSSSSFKSRNFTKIVDAFGTYSATEHIVVHHCFGRIFLVHFVSPCMESITIPFSTHQNKNDTVKGLASSGNNGNNGKNPIFKY